MDRSTTSTLRLLHAFATPAAAHEPWSLRMKTLITTLACALALSFALPAEAQMTNLAKCKVYNAKINLNEPKCLELGNLLFHKDKDPNWAKCEI